MLKVLRPGYAFSIAMQSYGFVPGLFRVGFMLFGLKLLQFGASSTIAHPRTLCCQMACPPSLKSNLARRAVSTFWTTAAISTDVCKRIWLGCTMLAFCVLYQRHPHRRRGIVQLGSMAIARCRQRRVCTSPHLVQFPALAMPRLRRLPCLKLHEQGYASNCFSSGG